MGQPFRSEAQGGQGTGNIVDVWIAVIVCGSLLVLMAVLSFWASRGPLGEGGMCLLAGALGSACGWVFGLILSPYNVAEGKTFRGVSKAAYGLVTGYLVAKLDPLVTAWTANAVASGPSSNGMLIVGVALTCFLSVSMATYISRRYWL